MDLPARWPGPTTDATVYFGFAAWGPQQLAGEIRGGLGRGTGWGWVVADPKDLRDATRLHERLLASQRVQYFEP